MVSVKNIYLLLFLPILAYSQAPVVTVGGLLSGTSASFSGTVSAQSVNAVYNPLLAPGSTIDAQIAYVENNLCSPSGPCHILIPPGPELTFSNSINIGNFTTVECIPSQGMSATEVGASPPALNYTGSGMAINMTGVHSYFIGCSLRVGSATTEGIHIFGYSDHVEHAYLMGGGSGTTLVHSTGYSPGSSNQNDDTHIENVSAFGYTGIGILIDHSNDTYLTNDEFGPAVGNTTSRTLVLDTAADGTYVTNFVGSNGGLNGLLVRNTIGSSGPSPVWIFAHNFQSDCTTGGDGWLFDSSLGTSYIDAVFDNSWAAGAGVNCSTQAVMTSAAAGVHISGGRGIWINSGSKIRANAADGVLMDSTNVSNVHIDGNDIRGNNWNTSGRGNNSAYSGVRVAANSSQISVQGNWFGNVESAGDQSYGVNIPSGVTVTGLNISGNLCNDNKIGCLSPAANAAAYETVQNNNVLGPNAPDSTPPVNNLFGNSLVSTPQNISFTPIMSKYCPNLNTGYACQSFFGVSGSNNNSAVEQFNYAGGSGSVSNYWSLGLYGNSNAVTLNGNGVFAVPYLQAINGINGVTSGSAAASGTVGQDISSLVAKGGAVSLATATPTNVSSISLSAGDWQVGGNCDFTASGVTAMVGSAWEASISTTSATLSIDGSEVPILVPPVTAASFLASGTIAWKQVTVGSATTVYLVCEATFTAGTVGGYGKIEARRMR